MRRLPIYIVFLVACQSVFGQTDSTSLEDSKVSIHREFSYTHIDELLQGKFAGTWVTQTSGIGGSDFSLRIRGTSTMSAGAEPLYVINGLPFYNESRNASSHFGPGLDFLSMIDPKNVESVEVLSNIQATALYGSRGANGVILIETKSGDDASFNVEGEAVTGVMEAFDQPSLLSGAQYAQYLNEHAVLNGLTAPYTSPGSFGNGRDWNKRLYKSGGFQNYRMNFGGTSDKTTYNVFGSYLDQEGVITNSGLERFNLQARLVSKSSERLSFNSTLLLSRQETNAVITDNPFGFGVVTGANRFSPLLGNSNILNYAVNDAGEVQDGSSGSALLQSETLNPIASSNLASSVTKLSRLLASTQVNYKVSESLNVNSVVGADAIFAEDFSFFSGVLQPESASGGIAINAKEQQITWYNRNEVSYSKDISTSNQLVAKGGIELQGFFSEVLVGNAFGFDNEALGFNSLSTGSSNTTGSNLQEWQLFAAFGSVQYFLDNAYEFSLSVRSDGSSRFGGNHQLFPAVGASVDLFGAGLLNSSNLISEAKVYTGFGKSGNQQIAPYLTHGRLDQQLYYLGGNQLKTFSPSLLGNNDLEMEETTQFDIGTQLLISDWLNVKIEYYNKATNNALVNLSVPAYAGVPFAIANVGEIKNSGIELSLSGSGEAGAVTWNVGINAAMNNSEIGSIPFQFTHGEAVKGISDWLIIKEGEEFGSIYGYEITGIVQTSDDLTNTPTLGGGDAIPGAYKYIDKNTDGVIDDADKVILGAVTPDIVYGLSGSVSAFGVELQFLFQGVTGNEMVNFNRTITHNLDGSGNISADAFSQRWTTSNTSGSVATVPTAEGKIVDGSIVEDASYMRLKYLSIAYELPQSLLDKMKVSSLKIFGSGRNVLTITDYSGADPEASLFKSNASSMGADFGGYPGAKLWTIGLKIGL